MLMREYLSIECSPIERNLQERIIRLECKLRDIEELMDKAERKDIREIAKESKAFVMKGNDPRDLPKHLRIKD